ncbi:tail fiber assembly protein [Herbaspirillum huttiense]|uniref:Tail fiber assembly protein n=2 Tax=Herbaspirillum huttiense TaxID=863372 RepID=A0AAJ2H3G4_9BURK|nr:tail fiber assembly protein [Herbaspirillum huttiense]MDR9834893.1 tail fiber assembly protein [Herbaspirillum huttiense]
MENSAPQIWNWHPVTFRLIRTEGPCYPDPDPLVPGSYLYPGCTTPIEPGTDIDGKVQEFDIEANLWKYVDAASTTTTPAIGESTPDELAAAVGQLRDQLLQEASLRIAPLQDEVDLGVATAATNAQLLLWKQYRIQLNRVPQQEGYPEEVVWPTAPGATP